MMVYWIPGQARNDIVKGERFFASLRMTMGRPEASKGNYDNRKRVFRA
jgi:hypothetical protein